MTLEAGSAVPANQEITAHTVEAGSVAASAKSDLNVLGMLAMPEEFSFKFPAFYLVLFSLLTGFAAKVERFAIGIPRGFAKTTFIKLLCLWYIVFSHKQFILIVGASEALAINTLSDIADMLDSSNIRLVFGNWRSNQSSDQAGMKVFHFRGRSIILRAVGAGTSVRGINRKMHRPDVIIMDDVQTKEDAENKDLADALMKWILGTLSKTRSPKGCTYIYVGNMYPQNAILERLKNSTQWTSLIVGGITSAGKSLWPELKPLEELLEEYQNDLELGHPEIFISEVLNSTEIALLSGIDVSQIPFLPGYYDNAEPEGSFILIDPSSGKKTGDDCSLEHYSVCDGRPIFDELRTGTFTPLQTINTAIELGIERNTRLICVEDVAYQSTLLFWFDYVCRERGISGFYFMPVSPKSAAKNNRIKKGLVRLIQREGQIAPEIYLHNRVRSQVISQIIDWNPLKVNNRDDIIDGIGYVDEVLQLYPELIVRDIMMDDRDFPEAAQTEDIMLPF